MLKELQEKSIFSKLLDILMLSNYMKLLKHQDSCSLSWNMQVEENFSITSWNVNDCKKMKHADFSSKSYLVLNTFIKSAFAIEILNQKIYF